jgi:microcystin-dependent protein
MATPPLIATPFAASGDQTVLPITDPNGFVNFSTGYTPDYEINLASGDPQAKAVERGIQNYLFNILTTGMQTWQTSNRPPWYSGMPGGYAKYAEVTVADASGNPQPYRSLAAGNVSTPGNSTTWEYIEGTGEMIQNIPMPSGGPAGPGSMNITTATDFNTFINSGTYNLTSDAVVSASPNSPVNGGNQAGAGSLEVLVFNNAPNVYISQFFRDRNGLGFMRGATNGNWTAWKIWANSHQYTLGEIRMWTGTASEAAVQAAWGPGWHFCNGQNGTVDLRNYFILGAGGSQSPGSTGGSSSVTLSASNIPSHTHTITINDPSHAHAVSQSPHSHGLIDPGHAHGIYDPGHYHVAAYPRADHNIWVGGGQYQGYSDAIYATDSRFTSDVAATGIGIYGNGTGITISAANANVGVNASSTGITASAAPYGNGQAFNVTPPFFALTFVQYTGS